MEVEVATQIEEVKKCSVQYILALNDALNVINGKWKTPIIGSLLFGKMSPRMLSKELKDLENNGIVKRTVHDTTPVTVEYELTESGKTFQSIIDVMVEWAIEHRKRTFSK